MKRETRKIVLALLLNLFLIGVGLFVLDTLQIISIGQVFESLGLRKGYVPRVEDPFLLEREELGKQWKLLSLKEDELRKNNDNSQKKSQELKDLEDRLKSLTRNLKERENRIQQDSLDKTKRSERIRQIALQLMNMPPDKAVQRLESQQDNFLIIEVFRAMETETARTGSQSMVPYYLSLMNKDRAAAVQRIMANTSSVTNNDF